jgi:hypothetical protein
VEDENFITTLAHYGFDGNDIIAVNRFIKLCEAGVFAIEKGNTISLPKRIEVTPVERLSPRNSVIYGALLAHGFSPTNAAIIIMGVDFLIGHGKVIEEELKSETKPPMPEKEHFRLRLVVDNG